MGRKFFITGGTGLIGRALVRALLVQRSALNIDQLTLLTRNPTRFRAVAPDIADAGGIRLMQGDMSSVAWPQETFSDIVHGATDVSDMQVSDRLAYAWRIAEGTRRTLEYAKQSGCERYLYLSSGAVYGPGPYPDTGIPEGWTTALDVNATSTAYGHAKRFSEHLCALTAEAGEMAVRIARIFSVVGPESPVDGEYALGNFVLNALDRGSSCIRVKGDGRATRSFIHVKDVADWLIALNECPAKLATYNIGSEREVSIAELAALIKSAADVNKEILIEKATADYGGRSRYFPDTKLIREQLKVSESTSIENAISELVSRTRSERRMHG